MSKMRRNNGDLSIFQEGNVKDELENLQKWIDLTDTLNVESNGAPKTLNGWKQCWLSLKMNAISKLQRTIKKKGRHTKPTDIDKRIMSMIEKKPMKINRKRKLIECREQVGDIEEVVSDEEVVKDDASKKHAEDSQEAILGRDEVIVAREEVAEGLENVAEAREEVIVVREEVAEGLENVADSREEVAMGQEEVPELRNEVPEGQNEDLMDQREVVNERDNDIHDRDEIKKGWNELETERNNFDRVVPDCSCEERYKFLSELQLAMIPYSDLSRTTNMGANFEYSTNSTPLHRRSKRKRHDREHLVEIAAQFLEFEKKKAILHHGRELLYMQQEQARLGVFETLSKTLQTCSAAISKCIDGILHFIK
ncbi:thioredoxin domain-containing protein 2-like isoform X2 [Trichoplusia ni]|uniref:Thioredoxin domain-containing protein 2-like isoform X2 n=1 Tax=Trichoplusia ni TaxID=7111 RepID=A0A7E5VR22_TRINI|nr:thioredoxin domain-containing protein 2-like isoform X2 [Trichoplusia ni]